MNRRFAPIVLTGFLSTINFEVICSDIADISREYQKKGQPIYQMMLIGGGLSTCSSLTPSQCQNLAFDAQTIHKNLYALTRQTLDSWKNTGPVHGLGTQKIYDLNAILEDIYAVRQGQIADRSTWQSWLSPLFSALSELSPAQSGALEQFLWDIMEVRQQDKHGARLKETVVLTANKNRETAELYRLFVAQAALRMPKEQIRPRIAIVTASSRDPFAAVDFYQAVFEQAGADVLWLPLDAAYQHARHLERQGIPGCRQLTKIRAEQGVYHRESIYPELTRRQQQYCESPQKLLDDISASQGVFFNGGDQSLTLAALRTAQGNDSDAFTLIKQRMQSGLLIVGGTSAGTAVQSGGVYNGRPVPMISNGWSETAFTRGVFATDAPPAYCPDLEDCGAGIWGSDVTYQVSGGSGLFSLGILDTHFSERDRQPRLALLAAITGTRFAFGVDEATALLVRQQQDAYALHVTGQGGVYAVDSQSSEYWQQGQKRRLTFLSHYLLSGDSMLIERPDDAPVFSLAPADNATAKRLPGQWREQLNRTCGRDTAITWQQDGIAVVTQADSHTRWFTRNGQCGYLNLAVGIKN